MLAPSQGLQAGLLHEMLGRIPREESSVPQRRGRFWYYSVHSRGRQYRRFCRRPAADPAAPLTEHSAMDPQQPEEVLLDQDELAGVPWGALRCSPLQPLHASMRPAWLTGPAYARLHPQAAVPFST